VLATVKVKGSNVRILLWLMSVLACKLVDYEHVVASPDVFFVLLCIVGVVCLAQDIKELRNVPR
jgi:hypothetical protein